jgi:hypothetical protein
MKNLKNKSLGVMLFLLVSTHNLILNAMDSVSPSILPALLIGALLKTAGATPPVKSPVSQIHQGCLNPLAEQGGPKCYVFHTPMKAFDCATFMPDTFLCSVEGGASILAARVGSSFSGARYLQTSVDPCGAPFRVDRDKLAGEKPKTSDRKPKNSGRKTKTADRETRSGGRRTSHR